MKYKDAEEFDALLAKRDECQVSHDLACQILAEEGENALTRHTCLRTYFELEEVEQQIAAACADERAQESKPHPPRGVQGRPELTEAYPDDVSWTGPAGDAWIAAGGTKD